MYIPEFWCGVLAAVLVEIGLIVIGVVVSEWGGGKK